MNTTTITADDWLRRLANCFDQRGDILWKESAAGTSSQLQCFALPDDLALFARNNFNGRLRPRQRSGGYDWTLSGRDADALAQAILPHLQEPQLHALYKAFVDHREAIKVYRGAASTRKISPAEKAWRREVEGTFKELRLQLRTARGLPLHRRRAEMRPVE
jgi:hypothetical protein